MKSKLYIQVALLVYSVFLFISCSGTDFIKSQINDAYIGGPVSNILIIAITGNEHNRRSFEQKFVAHLHVIGIGAVSSEKVIPMPPDLEMEKEVILEAIEFYDNI